MRQDVQTNLGATQAVQQLEAATEKLRELTPATRLLVVSHMPLAAAMAWRMRGYGVSLEDLRQEGFLGLCEAAVRYDEQAECSFAAYASHWCRRMMLDAISRYGSPMQLSARQRAIARFYSLDTEQDPQDDDDEAQADSLLAALIRKQEGDDLLRTGQLRRIDDALSSLQPQERQFIAQYYGLDTPRLSISEMAAARGISKPRASVLHREALRKLEAALRQRPLVDYLTPWLDIAAGQES